MKKIAMYLLLMMLMSFVACQAEEATDVETEQEQKEQEADTNAEEEETSEKEEEQNEILEVTVYVPDEMYEKTETVVVECEELTEEILLDALREYEVLSDECGINSMTQEGTTLHIDVNTGFGDRLRSMGTAGESMIIKCFVNTFLEAYQCDQMMITENEEILTTGHVEYTEYMGMFE